MAFWKRYKHLIHLHKSCNEYFCLFADIDNVRFHKDKLLVKLDYLPLRIFTHFHVSPNNTRRYVQILNISCNDLIKRCNKPLNLCISSKTEVTDYETQRNICLANSVETKPSIFERLSIFIVTLALADIQHLK